MAQLKELTVSGITELADAYGVTQSSSDNSLALATTEFVKQAYAMSDALTYKGSITPIYDTLNGGTLTPAATTGDVYKADSSGYIDGIYVNKGAMVICRDTSAKAEKVKTYSQLTNSDTYDSSLPYYIRMTRDVTEYPDSGSIRIGDWDQQYIYKQINVSNPQYYISESFVYTASTDSASCFYINIEDPVEGTIRQYISYNSNNFLREGAIPVYVDLTSTNFSRNYSYFYKLNANVSLSQDREFYEDIQGNWDFISSDDSGYLYKTTEELEAGYALIAADNYGGVSTSDSKGQSFKLTETATKPFAESVYRQPDDSVLGYSNIVPIFGQVETLEESLNALEKIVMEDQTSSSTNYVTFEEAGFDLNLNQEFLDTDFTYIGYLSEYNFLNKVDDNVLVYKEGGSYVLPTNYVSGKSYMYLSYNTTTGNINEVPISITNATDFNNKKVKNLYTKTDQIIAKQATGYYEGASYYSHTGGSGSATADHIESNFTEVDPNLINSSNYSNYYWLYPKYEQVTGSYNPDTVYYQRSYYYQIGDNYLPIVYDYNTSGSTIQTIFSQKICTEGYKYYVKKFTSMYNQKYPGLVFDEINTIQSKIVQLYEMIDGNHIAIRRNAIANSNSLESTKEAYSSTNNTSSVIDDIIQMRKGLGISDAVILNPIGPIINNTVTSGSDENKETVYGILNTLSNIVGINNYYTRLEDVNSSNIVYNDGNLPSGTITANKPTNMFDALNDLITTTDYTLDWFTITDNRNQLAIGHDGTDSTQFATYRLVINKDCFDIYNQSGEQALLQLQQTNTANGSYLKSMLPFQVSNGTLKWTMQIRDNGNLTFAVAEEE